MRAIVVNELGGPAVLTPQERPTPTPGPGELLVDVHAAGVNFMDTGTRRFGTVVGDPPFVPGVEGAGRVRALGPDVTGFAVGDRVAWLYAYGSYAEQVVLPATAAVPIPDDIADDTAAGLMMQGITAHHFTTEAAPVTPGQVTLVHAAAGGVGQKLTQLIKVRGGTVIGLVSTPAKAGIARRAGADEVLVSTGDAFVTPVLARGGVDTVFDGGGETTFRASMKVLRPHGTLLHYGVLIGDAATITMTDLPNSIKICYPRFFDHIPTRETLLRHSTDLFNLVRTNKLTVEIGATYPLKDAAQAHKDLESRTTTGKLLLLP